MHRAQQVETTLAHTTGRTFGPGRSVSGLEFELQKQSHDSVLREKDRLRGAFQKTCFYVLDNPRRKGLVERPQDWIYLGAVVPGYPFLRPFTEDFWEQFWKLYQQRREPVVAASRQRCRTNSGRIR